MSRHALIGSVSEAREVNVVLRLIRATIDLPELFKVIC